MTDDTSGAEVPADVLHYADFRSRVDGRCDLCLGRFDDNEGVHTVVVDGGDKFAFCSDCMDNDALAALWLAAQNELTRQIFGQLKIDGSALDLPRHYRVGGLRHENPADEKR